MSDHISRLDPSQGVDSSCPKLCVRSSLIPRLRNKGRRESLGTRLCSLLGDKSCCCMSFFLAWFAMTNLLRTHFCDCFSILQGPCASSYAMNFVGEYHMLLQVMLQI